jgi:tetratricopeptide (TPR) repeat protein
MNLKHEKHQAIFGGLLMLLLWYSGHLKAQDVYKCPNAEGKLVFSDRSCSNGYIKEGKNWISVADYEKSQVAATDKNTNQPVKSVQNKPQEIPTIAKQQAAQPTTTPTAWDEQMQAGKAAFEKLDIEGGEKHYISALELTKSFDKNDPRYIQTLMAIGDFSDVNFPVSQEVMKLLHDKALEDQENADKKVFVIDEKKTQAGLKIFEEARKKDQLALAVAEPYLQKAVEMTEQARGAEYGYLSLALENLAKFYDGQGRFRDAASVFERSFSMAEKKNVAKKANCSDINIKSTGMFIDQTYFLLMSRGHGWAEAVLKFATKCSEDPSQADAPNLITPFYYLAMLYKGQGRTDEADIYYQKVQHIQEKSLQPPANKNPGDINTLLEMAGLAVGQEHFDDAENYYQKALALSEQIYGAENIKLINAINGLAEVYISQKKYDQAEAYYKRGLAIAQKSYSAEDEQLASFYFKLGSYYDVYEKRFADAEPMYKNALAIWEKKDGYNSAVADVRERLINVYNAQGKKSEAEALSKPPAKLK